MYELKIPKNNILYLYNINDKQFKEIQNSLNNIIIICKLLNYDIKIYYKNIHDILQKLHIQIYVNHNNIEYRILADFEGDFKANLNFNGLINSITNPKDLKKMFNNFFNLINKGKYINGI